MALPAMRAIPARAEASYPVRAIKVVIPFSAGSVTDICVRILAERLAPRARPADRRRQSIRPRRDRRRAGGAVGAAGRLHPRDLRELDGRGGVAVQ